MSPDERVAQYLDRHGLAGARLVPLTPDASDRRYVRVAPPHGGTQVLAVYPGPIDYARMPFAHVAGLLREMPVPVPRVLGHDDNLGIVAQEDLGDVTLQAHLPRVTGAAAQGLYRDAVAIIATLQRRGAELATSSPEPYSLAFDVEKLTFELNFFVTHFLQGHRGVTLSVAEREALASEFAALTQELSSEPRVVCHRDYHSRNLMVQQGQLAVIDFQDARMGPDTYDLVSLLRDSYVGLEVSDVEMLIAFFLSLDRGPLGDAGPADRFRERFDTMAVQRNLKALGTFGYQASARRNDAYLRDVPRTLGYLRDTFARRPRFGRLRDVLADALPELR
jgi:aminoglycoside/choline kinase family phosphotransferase